MTLVWEKRDARRFSPLWLPAFAGTTWRFTAFRLIPQRIHFFQRRSLERTPLRRQRAFDVGKAPLEFRIGSAQRTFRIGADMAREVDQREQEVAGFFRELICIAAVERGL